MRKTLLIAAAALAASVISSQAQVYSQNIVGYVNTPIPGGFVCIANPLDAMGATGVNNDITNVIPVFSGNYDGDVLYYWSVNKYVNYTIDAGQWPSGIGNANDTAQSAVMPKLSPGMAILIQNTVSAITNTFVGTVHVDAAATGSQVVGTATNHIGGGFTFLASKLPIGGQID